MTATPTAVERTVDGLATIELAAGDYGCTFLPGLGMVGSSFTWRGAEHVDFDLERYRSGHQSGIPLLHPWANRLSRLTYEVDGQWVDFDPIPPIRLDGDLPIHGTMTASEGWDVELVLADGSRALTQARYRFGSHPDHLRSFPFPHEITVFAELGELGLRVTTTITNTGVRGVPVSFGWHPYFTLPGAPRSALTVLLPDREHLALDLQMLPTGESTHEAAEPVVLGEGLGERTFDDSYRLAGAGRGADGRHELALEVDHPDGTIHRLVLAVDDQYPYAQVYAPSGSTLVALEPMTAPVNALVTGDHRTVPPGESMSATFVVRVDRLDPEPDEGNDG